MRWLVAIVILMGGLTLAAPGGTSTVEVKTTWEYKGFPLAVKLYEVSGSPRLWETKSVASKSSAPLGPPISTGTFSLLPGQHKRLALVVDNDTDAKLYFFAAPHSVSPVESALGFKFKCLCINHAYTVGPKETWYRIVDFQLSPNFEGREFTVTHTVIGISAERAQQFSSDPAPMDM